MTRRAPLIVVSCAVLLSVAFWYLLYRPRQAEQAGYNDETAQLESRRSQLQGEVAALREVERNADDYRSQFERLAQYIPGGPGQPAALRELQRASDESGVKITETVFGDPAPVEGAPESGDAETTLAQIPTQMTVEGGYFQVVDLLRRIEVDLARAIKIDTVAMAEAEEKGFPELSATWTGQIFAVLPLGDVLDESGQPATPATPTEAPTGGASSPDQPTASPTGGAAPAGADISASSNAAAGHMS
jgi:Tfp pilus assembly protein PilO